MADSVSVGVNERRSVVSYDRSGIDLTNCKKDDFRFSIESNGGKEAAVLQIYSNGTLCRQHMSDPFPAGAFQKKSSELNKQNYNVHMKKNGDFKLGDFFY